MPSALSASSTGAIRAISVSDETGAASGLLDAGPRSITSAPSAISLRACAMAASGARYRPPSEKLSEVMLTMPKMMSDLFMGASIIIIIEQEPKRVHVLRFFLLFQFYLQELCPHLIQLQYAEVKVLFLLLCF